MAKQIFMVMCCLIGAAFSLGSCKPDLSDDNIPYVPFGDININLSLPQYFALQSSGGTALVNDGGVKGLIVYHHPGGEYYAFERNCSFQPNDACSTVGISSTGLGLEDSCCGSQFDLNGNPVGGPAWRPLRRYVTRLTGTQLLITDEIMED